MAKMQSLSLTTRAALIPNNLFEELIPNWDKLKPESQTVVERESQEFARARFHEGASRLEQGKRLVLLQERLIPINAFVPFLKLFNMSLKTAYRRINAYKSIQHRIPDNVLSVILYRNVDIASGDSPDLPFGKYTKVIKALPVPKTEDKAEINAWVDQLETKYRQYRSEARHGNGEVVDHDNPEPEILLKSAFRAARVCFRKLPNNHKTRAKWLEQLAGFLLAEAGMSSAMSIAPQAAPEDFRRGVGFPKGRSRKEE